MGTSWLEQNEFKDFFDKQMEMQGKTDVAKYSDLRRREIEEDREKSWERALEKQKESKDHCV